MIDEDLYKIATDELNSDARKPDVWARACALASDDHDEARFLYTNLRVEEMLSKDGKKRTFSTTEQQRSSMLSSTEGTELNSKQGTDAPNLEMAALNGDDLADSHKEDTARGQVGTPIDSPKSGFDSNVTSLASSRAGVDSKAMPLPTDELDSFALSDLDAPASASGTDALSDNVVEFDDETMAELAALSEENTNSRDALSGITGKPANASASEDHDKNSGDSESITTSLFGASAIAASTGADQLRAVNEPTTDFVEHQPGHDATAESGNADHHKAESVYDLNSENAVAADYVDENHVIDDDDTLGISAELDTGTGRSFMVFNQHGALKAVKRGVSWPALLFTFPWLLSKAMFGTALAYGCLWLISLGGLLATASLWMSAGADTSTGIKLWTAAFALLAIIGLIYIPFRYGNRWVAEKLQNQGFRYEASVSAENKLNAVDRFLRFSQENSL